MKQWVGAPSSATIFVDQNGVVPFDASTVATANGDNTAFDYPVSTPVTVGEVAVPTGYAATIDCGQGLQPYTGGPFPVIAPATDGATLTCTITNTQLFATVRVVKQWEGTPSSATIFVDQDGVAPFDASTVATADGDTTSFDYPALDARQRRRGRRTGRLSRDDPLRPDRGGAPAVCRRPVLGRRSGYGRRHHHLHDHEHPAALDRAGRQAMGRGHIQRDDLRRRDRLGAVRRLQVATASGDDTSFSYPVSTSVTLGETAVPAGFRAQIDCGAGPQAYAGGPFPVTSPAEEGATLTCTVTNTPQTTVRVIKQWAGAPELGDDLRRPDRPGTVRRVLPLARGR